MTRLTRPPSCGFVDDRAYDDATAIGHDLLRVPLAVLVLLGALTCQTYAATITEEQRQAAALAVREAETAYLKHNDVDRALEHYQRALPHTDDPLGVRFNIGRCLMGLGRRVEALDTFLELLDQKNLPEEIRKFSDSMVAQLLDMPHGHLSVECDVGDARVYLGAGEGQPCPVENQEILAGFIEVLGISPDETHVREMVEVAPEESETVYLALAKEDRTLLGPILLAASGGALLAGGYYSLIEAEESWQPSGTLVVYDQEADSARIVETPQLDRQRTSEGEIYRTVGYVMLATGAAAVVGGLTWYALDEVDRQPALSVRPTPNGLVLSGRW